MRIRLEAPRALEEKKPERTREVDTRATPLSPGEIKSSLATAYQKLHGREAPRELLDTLTAQVCTETASGARMHDYNFGGIKGQSPNGLTARVSTREVLDGREVKIKDGFRAYRTPIEGALDYVSFLERRFPRALEAAEKGDVNGYVGALKAGRYFTADESAYAAAIRTHKDVTVQQIEGPPSLLPNTSDILSRVKADELILPPDGEMFATSAAVTQVLDAMNAAMVRVASTPNEEEA
ncbi:MAG: hypothetical protein JNL21_38315 [Myxococcales bacterium]|nr:hypothetical protein [Myxococcales bacterium]